MSYYSEKNIEKKQWYVRRLKWTKKIKYIVTSLPNVPVINKDPLTLEEAEKFKVILNKLNRG